MYRKVLCFLILWVICSPNLFAQNLTPAELRTQYTKNPIGLDELNPGLSWKLESGHRGAHQTAYRILVASDKDKLSEESADIWDSGIVRSDEQVQIPYEGKGLKSARRYYWTVSVWDDQGQQSEYGEPAFFETGLLNKNDWKGVWISAAESHPVIPIDEDVLEPGPAPHFRKGFTNQEPISSARLYISGLGYYEAFINGERVGDRLLDPAKSRYDKTALYVTYDVTDHLLHGENAIGVILGTGWYNFHTEAAWDFDSAPWRAPGSLKAQIVITYEDGSTKTIATDRSWKTTTGPIVFDGIHNGETFDARLTLGDWTYPTADTSGWGPAYEVVGPAGKLKNQLMPPIRHVRSLSPVEVTNPEKNLQVYDFGENITGSVRLVATGPEGAEIVIRHGERLYDDGTLNNEELSRFVFSGETQTSRYILGPDQPSNWRPSFVYYGFQYTQVEVPEGVEILKLTAEVIHTDFEVTGSFESSNPLFNKIHAAKKLSYLGNYHGYPTDCPHREKIGWSGDAHLVTEGGLINFETVSSYMKWMDDFADEQRETGQLPGIIPSSGWGYVSSSPIPTFKSRGYGPQWEGAFVLIPWYLFQHTGDRSILERYFDPIVQYMRYLERHSEDNYTLSFGIDDHKTLVPSNQAVLATGHFHSFSNIVAKMAKELGKEHEVAYFNELSGKIKKGYRERFYNEEAGTWDNGSQMVLAGTLYHDLAEPGDVDSIMEQLIQNIQENDYHLTTGVIGTKYLLGALSEYGRTDVMYRIANQRAFPSWGYWIEKGATTLWQNWDGTQSRNHVMFGSIDEWFYKAIVGIRPDHEKPGFKNIIIKPEFIDDLDWAEGSYDTWRGTVKSEWEKSDRAIDLRIEIPVNTTARVYLPDLNIDQISESGNQLDEAEGVTLIGLDQDKNRLIVEVTSGNYRFDMLLD
ncbi:family 78 glycoside hydrolase catalytic domain [Rhodohalobacter sp.]|uniref:family 78 glycoside hydrolase catalytic domain n=1 Tax=Rhodohalobacter sp. TaxID=1974210 RepID=UPI0035637487